jgi:hypothetical protein
LPGKNALAFIENAYIRAVKSFRTLGRGVNVIKTLFLHNLHVGQIGFQPSLIFVGKVRSLPQRGEGTPLPLWALALPGNIILETNALAYMAHV